MVSIAVPGGRAPHSTLHDAVDWGRVVVATLARGVVGTVLGLALWAAAPALIGWQPTTVVTGSMEPRLVPGDVVVSRPVPPAEVLPGRILLADDPDQPGHLRMHRYVEPGPGGTLVTKGDANPGNDSTPLAPDAVHGVAFLRVPFVAAPVTWLRDGDWTRLVLLALGLAAVLALCTADGSLRRLAESDGEDPSDDGDGHDGPRDGSDGRAGREARGGAAPSLPSGGPPVVTRRSLRRRARRRRLVRRLGGGAAAVVLALGTGALASPSAVAAPFAAVTGSGSSYGAATAVRVPTLTCVQSSANAVTIAWTYPTDVGTPDSFDLVSGSTQVASVPGTESSTTLQGGGLLALGATYTLQVRTNLGGTWTVTGDLAVRVRVTSVLGIATATCVTP